MLDVLEARFDMVPLDIIKTIQVIDEIVMLESLLKKTIKVENLGRICAQICRRFSRSD
jgi:hypothetical protein